MLRNVIDKFKDSITMSDESVASINSINANTCTLIPNKMDQKILIKFLKTDQKGRKPYPFWTIELDNLFEAVVGKERVLRKCK